MQRNLTLRYFSVSVMMKIAISVWLALLSGFATAASIETRATGGYVQNPSGKASFTMYSGCGSPGEVTVELCCREIEQLMLNKLRFSLWYFSTRVHSRDKSTILRIWTGLGSWRCLWKMLRSYWGGGSILALLHRPFPHRCC